MIVLDEYTAFHNLQRTGSVQILSEMCLAWHLHVVALPDGQRIPVSNFRDLLRKYQFALFPHFGVCVVMQAQPLGIAKSPLCYQLDQVILKESVECFKV